MKIASRNPVFFPGRLLSLWDMNQILTEKFLHAWVLFMREFEKAGHEKANYSAVIDGESRQKIVNALDALKLQCEMLGLNESK
jgi:hypothetical protein